MNKVSQLYFRCENRLPARKTWTPAEINQFNIVFKEDTVFFNTRFEYALFLNQQFFDFLLNGDDLRFDLGSLVLGYASRDDWSADTTGTSKSCKDIFLNCQIDALTI